MDDNEIVFEVAKDPNAATDANASAPVYPPNFDYDDLRRVNYTFPSRFLKFATVGTMLRFKVGDQPLKNFRMIERHYHAGKLVKSYDFNFQFCIPNSTNEWETIYDMPEITPAEFEGMMKVGTESDSFYFVDGKLCMHNKATYKYMQTEESKR